MPDKEYQNYLEAIKNFIKSDKIYSFSAECFAEILVNEILKGENNE
jgi:cell fate regulator YaaT (PSP1 superfamily)